MEPYRAEHTGKLTVAGVPDTDAEAVHEVREDGLSLCGRPHAKERFKGMPVTLRDDGPGMVDCGNCQRSHSA